MVDLSKLLRHLLYDNNQAYVPLRQEVDFMRNYVELMRIRLSENVKQHPLAYFEEKGR